MWHPLRTRTGRVPVLEPDLTLTGLCRLLKGLAGLELDVLTVITKSLSMLKETNQMEREMCSRSHLRSKSQGGEFLSHPIGQLYDNLELLISSSQDMGLAACCPVVHNSPHFPRPFPVSIQPSRLAHTELV